MYLSDIQINYKLHTWQGLVEIIEQLRTKERRQSKNDSKDQESIQSCTTPGYNHVPHLTQYTKRESYKIIISITYTSQEVNPFPAGDHKAAMDWRVNTTNTRHK